MIVAGESRGSRATAGDRGAWVTPVLLFIGVGVVVWLVVLLSARILPREYLFPRSVHVAGGPLVEPWVRWDSGWYREIVRHGYVYFPGVQSSVVYFPAYPLAIAALAPLTGVEPGGVVVSLVSGLGVAVLFFRWCADRLSSRATVTALGVLLVYPCAWYLYGAVYSDALFLLSALAAFVLVERERYWSAGLAAMLATAGRPTGIAVAIGIVLLALEAANVPVGRRRFDPRGLTRATAPSLIGFAGLAGWMIYLWARFGDPLLFVHAEGGWGQGAGPSTWLKFHLIHRMVAADAAFPWGLLVHGAVGIAALASVPLVVRRFGWAYGIYVLIVVAIPVVGTKDFMSTARYVLAAFPCFALVGAMLAERPSAVASRVWLAMSGVALLFLSAMWSMGKYIA